MHRFLMQVLLWATAYWSLLLGNRHRTAALRLGAMEPPMKHKSIAMPVNTSEEEVENLLVKRRRMESSGSIVQPQQESEVSDMEIKVPDDLRVEVSIGMDPMDVVDCAVQSSGDANGCIKGDVRDVSCKGNGPATAKLPRICTAIGCKGPSYDFEEQGPPHNRLFICKVTLHLEGLTNTVMECFSDLKPKKQAAKEQAAQGALWCLKHFGHVK